MSNEPITPPKSNSPDAPPTSNLLRVLPTVDEDTIRPTVAKDASDDVPRLQNTDSPAGNMSTTHGTAVIATGVPAPSVPSLLTVVPDRYFEDRVESAAAEKKAADGPDTTDKDSASSKLIPEMQKLVVSASAEQESAAAEQEQAAAKQAPAAAEQGAADKPDTADTDSTGSEAGPAVKKKLYDSAAYQRGLEHAWEQGRIVGTIDGRYLELAALQTWLSEHMECYGHDKDLLDWSMEVSSESQGSNSN